jgi:hypothetical protein
VLRVDRHFELRDYPMLTVVETSMTRSDRGSDGSFSRLFGFITGRNEDGRSIAMTTPVFVSGNDSGATMAFVLPARMRAEQAPRPTDEAVTLRDLPSGQFAVLRYPGGRSADNEAEALGRLRTWMAREGLSVLSTPMYGYFDPPWTPGFLRRNEVMLRTVASR